MPIYEYQCKRCDGRFEKVLTTSAPQEIICPHCGSADITRLLSSFATGTSSSSSCAPGGG